MWRHFASNWVKRLFCQGNYFLKLGNIARLAEFDILLEQMWMRLVSLQGSTVTPDAARRRKDMWIRSCAVCKALLHKLQLCDSARCHCGWIG